MGVSNLTLIRADARLGQYVRERLKMLLKLTNLESPASCVMFCLAFWPQVAVGDAWRLAGQRSLAS